MISLAKLTKMAKFSAELDEKLIEEIQKFPAIFDYENENYKNYGIKENGWKKISISIQKDVEECKKRWKSIKDTYFRNKKKLRLGTGSSAANKPVKWDLYRRLTFLDQVKHARNTTETLASDITERTRSGGEENDEDLHRAISDIENVEPENFENFSPRRKKTKSNEHENFFEPSPSCTSSMGIKCSSRRPHTGDSRDAFLKRFEERAQKRTEILEAISNKEKEAELDKVDLFITTFIST